MAAHYKYCRHHRHLSVGVSMLTISRSAEYAGDGVASSAQSPNYIVVTLFRHDDDLAVPISSSGLLYCYYIVVIIYDYNNVLL